MMSTNIGKIGDTHPYKVCFIGRCNAKYAEKVVPLSQTIFSMTQLTLYYLLTVNVVAFLMYGLDKLKAKTDQWRIPESTLLLLAVVGGSLGAWAGMQLWRHKTQHAKFKYGIPLIFIVQVFLIGYFM